MNLEPELILLIKTCVKKILPSAKIFIFGSRVKGTNREFSDIDIALQNPGLNDQKINSQILAKIRFELEESALPYKFDLVDYKEIDKKILGEVVEI